MYIVKDNDLIVLAGDTLEEVEPQLQYIKHTSVEYTDEKYVLFSNGSYLTQEEITQKEQERIQSLYMTRSDFFDGTIRAFNATEEALKPVIAQVLQTLPISDTEKLVAINNFENALNFYRKHTLFTLLSNTPLPIGEQTVTITSEQWDKFFDETQKKNPNAYEELLPAD